MFLVVKVEGIEYDFPASFFNLKRKLGEPVQLDVTLYLSADNAHWLEELSDKLLKSSPKMEILWQDSPLFSKVIISTARSLDKKSTTIEVMLTGFYTKISPEAFIPHKRILKADNLKSLLYDNFSYIISWENSIGSHLSDIEFPDKKKTNHIQHGISDFEMLSYLIKCYNQLSKPQDRLIISGDAKTEKCKLLCAQDKKYRELGLNNTRAINKQPGNEIASRIKFGKSQTASFKDLESGYNIVDVCYNIRHGNINTDFWNDWKTKTLPLYYNDQFVCEMDDHFQNTGGNDFLEWDTYIHFLPENSLIVTPDLQNIGTWTQNGKITKRDSKNEWLEVSLDHFEDGYEKLDVRLYTPYSGKDQSGGLHLVPEDNSEVLVIKQPDWMASAVLLGNIRNKETSINAPYWQMEDPVTWNFKDIDFTLRKINAEASDDILFKSKTHKVVSSEEIELKTNGITTKIDNSQMNIS
ncbi:MAG: hypothetical protein QM737_01200 [Ferruginibacter sp.]